MNRNSKNFADNIFSLTDCVFSSCAINAIFVYIGQQRLLEIIKRAIQCNCGSSWQCSNRFPTDGTILIGIFSSRTTPSWWCRHERHAPSGSWLVTLVTKQRLLRSVWSWFDAFHHRIMAGIFSIATVFIPLFIASQAWRGRWTPRLQRRCTSGLWYRIDWTNKSKISDKWT